MKIASIFMVYNEARYMRRVLRHQVEQGLQSYVIDNESTDGTAEIVRSFIGKGVIGHEIFPRRGIYEHARLLGRIEQLHGELGADWYLYNDADQFRYAPNPFATLAEGIAEVDRLGDNAIDFDVFDFMPSGFEERYEGDDFVERMQYYYYFRREAAYQVKAWKNLGQKIDLAGSAGHRVAFDGRRIHPQPFIQRHYYVLSHAHAVEKYCERRFDPAELRRGWHGKRATLRPEHLYFPPRSVLKKVRSDNVWDRSDPWPERALFALAPRLQPSSV